MWGGPRRHKFWVWAVLCLGGAFESNLQLPAGDIKAHFEAARTKMSNRADTGHLLRLVGDIAGWLSFAATSLITLVVGFYGRAPRKPTILQPRKGSGHAVYA